LVEVASCWGVFEWLLWDAFEQGYRVGVMCNSDGHKGRPGAEGPGAGQFGIGGGLTCVLAEALTRSAVFSALHERRCYGTTGPRVPVQVRASGRGTGPVGSRLLYRGREVIHVEQPAAFAHLDASRRVRLSWGGARIRGRGRRATWDGRVRVEGARIERVEGFA